MAESYLRDPDLRRLRALAMIDRRIKGKTYREIAQEFSVSEDTVQRTLTWAKKAELVVSAEDKILNELVPQAHEAFKRALAAENPEVAFKAALEIFKGTLPSFAKRPAASSTGASSESTDLSSYINTIRNGLIADGEVLGSERSSLPGDVGGSPQRQIPARASSDVAEGVSTPAASDGSPAEPQGNAADSE